MRPLTNHIPNIIDDIMRDVWVKEDLESIDTYFHPDARFYGRIRNTALTRSEFRDWVAQFQSMASITAFERVLTVTEDEENFAHVIRADLTSHMNGATGKLMGMFFDKLCDGKVIQSYANADLLTYFETTGFLPDNATLIMLGGTPLS
ncbi:nuclear transport factor 2 family protein [Tropicibacter sp. R15_0]|uniref:nuclear transport factor 2 family protein n=1 Tax=Tropicibacter sp. R15_0 TaxID=2821101 RepID=UPI001ADCFE06|nr:nuclear transport factor 2 family protein [Tropicibacter sp. R15_0]MBO9464687.1 nuclear transport factor 2 family protein [Tropicibacter sp. R15_0]